MLRVCNMASRRSVGANVCVRSWRALATAARGKSFADLGVPSYLLPGLEKLNWTKPTEIQEKIVASAETGSGKTAAFGLPLLKMVHEYRQEKREARAANPEAAKLLKDIHDLRLLEDDAGRLPRGLFSPLALVICPTKELAAQVARHIELMASSMPGQVKAECLAFSSNLEGTKKRLKGKKMDIAVGTAGTISHMLEARSSLLATLPMDRNSLEPLTENPADTTLDLTHCKSFVLDECDRLLSMGFFPEVKQILQFLPRPRKNLKQLVKREASAERLQGKQVFVHSSERMQVLLFSATLMEESDELMKRLAPRHTRIDLNPSLEVAKTIKEACYQVSNRRKTALLVYLLRRKGSLKGKQVLVFCRTQQRTERLAENLTSSGFNAGFIHSECSVSQRRETLASFEAGDVQILVSTDLAARGIDIDDLPAVVNFDVATSPPDHVHRIGRTGRAGKEGLGITFVSRTPQLVDFGGKLVEHNEHQMLNKIRTISGCKNLRPTKVPGPWLDDDVREVEEEERKAQRYSERRETEIKKLMEKKARGKDEKFHDQFDEDRSSLHKLERRARSKAILPKNQRYSSVAATVPNLSLRSLRDGRYEDVLRDWDEKSARKKGVGLPRSDSKAVVKKRRAH